MIIHPQACMSENLTLKKVRVSNINHICTVNERIFPHLPKGISISNRLMICKILWNTTLLKTSDTKKKKSPLPLPQLYLFSFIFPSPGPMTLPKTFSTSWSICSPSILAVTDFRQIIPSSFKAMNVKIILTRNICCTSRYNISLHVLHTIFRV